MKILLPCLKRLKPLSFVPAVLMMCLIFSFSSQTGEDSGSLSYKVSFQLVEIGNAVSGKGYGEKELGQIARQIEHPVRKLAHMTEYFLLSLTVSFPLYLYQFRGRKLVITSILFCAAFAAGDEYHQSFVAGRGPSVRDVLTDSTGAALGTAGTYLLTTLIRIRSRKKPRSER